MERVITKINKREMYINDKSNPPARQEGKKNSMFVFCYQKNNRHFCIGCYDYLRNVWVDNLGMVIHEDFVWCYLPIKQIKKALRSL